jgi:hypothetical protein
MGDYAIDISGIAMFLMSLKIGLIHCLSKYSLDIFKLPAQLRF